MGMFGIHSKFRRVASMLGAALGIGLLVSAGPAQAQEEFKLAEPGVLTVAVFSNGVPVIGYDTDDKLIGIDGVLLNSFAEKHNLKVKLYKTTFASTILAIQQGKADVGTWFYYTEDRAKQIRYTLPFLRETASVFTLKSNEFDGVESLKGKRVGVVVGQSFAPFVQKTFGSTAQMYPDGIAGGTALLNGQIDAYVGSSFIINEPPFVGTDNVRATVLKVGEMGLPPNIAGAFDHNFVSCSNKGLAAALDDELRRLTESGEWKKVIEEHGLVEDNYASIDPAPVQLCE